MNAPHAAAVAAEDLRAAIRSLTSRPRCSSRWGSTAFTRAARSTYDLRAPRGVHHDSARARHRAHALPARDEPQAARELGISQELPQPARLRVRLARHRVRHPRRRGSSRAGRRLDRGAVRIGSRALACRVLSGLPDRRGARRAAARRHGNSTSRPTSSGTSLLAVSIGCSRFACASS